MRIPNSFKQAQKRVFQDKRIYHMRAKDVVGSLGSIVTEPDPETRRAYTANVQYVSDRMTAEEYGLRIGIDLRITASAPLCIQKGDYVEFGHNLYRVTETPKYDSYCAYYAARE